MSEHIDISRDYVSGLTATLARLPHDRIVGLVDRLKEVRARGGSVFVAGNGGSAATASHMACDLQKTIAVGDRGGLSVVALSDNMPLITAIANDRSFDEVFSAQLEQLAGPGDLLVVISGSGNSPNITKCLDVARKLDVQTVGLLGMGGGRAVELVDEAIVVESDDYGIIEDVHMVLNHIVTTCLKQT